MSRAVGPRLAAAALVGLLAGAPAAAQVTTHPRAMGLPEAEAPRPDPADHRVELGNGLVAYVAEDRTVPLVTLSAFVNAGYADDPDGAAEALAGAYRRGGPAGMEPSAFHAALRSMAAEYRVALGPELLELTLDVPAEDAAAAMALLVRMLLEGPAVTEADLVAVRQGARAAHGADGEGPRYDGSLDDATALLRTHLLDGTAYAPVPDPDAVAGLTLADVDAFRRRYVAARNVTLAVGGDLPARQARAALGNLEALPTGTRNERVRDDAPRPRDERILRTYPADKLQGWLVVGTALGPVPRDDEAALDVMNYILGGGHFDTRLFREARDKRGLTNDASGFLEPATYGPGTYTFRTYGRPEVVRLLLHLTLREIEAMRSAPVGEEELFVAKGALADGVFAIRYRDGWATARSFAEEHARHGDLSWSATYPGRVRAVTADDVMEAARRYLLPDAMTGVLIGPLDEIRAAPSLEGEGALADYGRVVPGR
ncbi:MAG: pitrilysin family protein [Longimicrobiales bacterium]